MQLLGENADTTFDRLSATLEETEELGAEFTSCYTDLISRAAAQLRTVEQRREARTALKQIIDGDALRRGMAIAAESGMYNGSDPLSAAADDDKELLMTAQVGRMCQKLRCRMWRRCRSL